MEYLTEFLKTEINKTIDEIKKIENDAENLTDKTDLCQNYWILKEKYFHLKHNYDQLNKNSEENLTSKISDSLQKSINYGEESLKLLTEIKKYEDINFQLFLSVANLHFIYYEENREAVLEEYQKENNSNTPQLYSYNFIPALDRVFKNIEKAQKCVRTKISYYRKSGEFNTTAFYYEVLGDLFIHIFTTSLKGPNDAIATNLLKTINNAFDCYKLAEKHKNKILIPGEGSAMIRVEEYLKPFNEFYPQSKVVDISSKMNHLISEYPNYFKNKVKSFCWKSGNHCDCRKNQIFQIDEGNGVFVSMNYGLEQNFEFYNCIKKILNKYRLKPILKQDRIKTPSWTKEICCTIFNNKFAIVFLDKYSPNVVLELGVALGMGRKVIILVNKNYFKGDLEKSLFSMIRDYDCVTYNDINELFEKLIKAINGVYFDIIDYNIPKINEIFNENELKDYNKLIQESFS